MQLRNVKFGLICTALPLALAACAGGGGDRPSTPSVGPVRATVSDTPVQVGPPYRLGSQTYTPVDQADYDEVGYASWYGSELHGNTTANGESFQSGWVSAAHRTLPLPSYVEVTRLDTGRTILVRINDRGPADPNRLIDLSAGAAEQLGIAELGMVPVRVRRVTPPESERLTLRRGENALTRVDTPDSLLEILRERAVRLPRPAGYTPQRGGPPPVATPPSTAPTVAPPTTRPIRPAPSATPPRPSPSNPPVRPTTATPPAASVTPPAAPAPTQNGRFIVQVGAFSSRERADNLAERIGASVVVTGNIFRVRYGPFATEAQAQAAVAHARRQGQPGAIIQRAR